jgi:hypothetical protein
MKITIEITSSSGTRTDEEHAAVIIAAIGSAAARLPDSRITGVSWGGKA